MNEACMATELYALPPENEQLKQRKLWPRAGDRKREERIQTALDQLKKGLISIETFLQKSFTVGVYCDFTENNDIS